MSTLSLCMVVRDDARTLARCLDSVRGIVDEICIVDLGANEETLQIAIRAGAVLTRGPWENDAAAARNASLAMAKSPWALVLEANEELEPNTLDRQAVRRKLIEFSKNQPHAIGQLVAERIQGGEVSARVSVGRLIPTHASLRYWGRVAEQLESDAQDPAPWPRVATGLTLRSCAIPVANEAVQRKLTGNLAALEAAVEERPQAGQLWRQLGLTLHLLGAHERALTALEHALALSDDREDWPIHALEIATQSMCALGHEELALELLRRGCELAPNRADTWFLRSTLEMKLGALVEAERGFRHCLELPDHVTTIDSWPGANSYGAAYSLGILAEAAERLPEARVWYERALHALPTHAPSRAALERLLPAPAGLSTGDSIR